MKTQSKTIASLLSACIWADGEYDEAERITAEEVAEAFKIPTQNFNKSMIAAMEEVQNLSPEEITAYVAKHAKNVDPEETNEVYLAVMQMMLCDNEITGDEVHNLLTMADALDIDHETAILLLCDMVKTEPDLEVTFENEEN